jgi:O-antigen/teichoic acid export membrane protein
MKTDPVHHANRDLPNDADLPEDGDFSDMLSEMRIVLPGAQMLAAFLIILPFNGGFRQIVQTEKYVFLATLFFALTSLILLSAPAVQHRVMRPLMDRERFKRYATRQIVAGSVALGIALVLGTNLVVSEVFGHGVGLIGAAIIGVIVATVWWLLPLWLKRNTRM